ncbi:MAG: PAS domain-containing protein, partial [Alphaproteobacteria bacterium]|nr:PAS domain-containing protein [Alphaproteobacteria bacterium]
MSVAAAVAEYDAPTLGPALSRADGVERRACAQALQLWREAAAPRRMPSVSAIRPETAASLWPHLFLIEWLEDFEGARVVYAGAVLVEALGTDPTGRLITACWPAESQARVRFLHETTVELLTP